MNDLKFLRGLRRIKPISAIPIIGIALLLILLPLFTPSYLLYILTWILIYAIIALGLNLLVGYTGLISFGQAAFFGIAAYTTGILIVHFGVDSFWLIAPASIFLAVLIAAIIGCFIIHLYLDYFLLITLAFSQLAWSVAWKWTSLTGGSDGFPGIPRPDLGFPISMSNSANFYYFVFIIFIICFFLIYRLINSPFGHTIVGIRENEPRMKILGYNTWRYKYVSFIIAGALAGIAGVLNAYLHGCVQPSDCGGLTGITVMLMVILGSCGTFIGPFVGAALLVGLNYITSSCIPDLWPIILGVIFVICAMWLRGGLGVYLIRYWKKVEM